MKYNLRGFCPLKACRRFNGKYLSSDQEWKPSGVFYLRNRDNQTVWTGTQETIRVDNHTAFGTSYVIEQSSVFNYGSAIITIDPTRYTPPWIANRWSGNSGTPAADLFQADTGRSRFYNITPIRVGCYQTGAFTPDQLTATVDFYIGENMTERATIISRDVYYVAQGSYVWFYLVTCFEVEKTTIGKLFISPVINLSCIKRSGTWRDENGVVWNFGDDGFLEWIYDTHGNRVPWGFNTISTTEYVAPDNWTKRQ